MFIEERNTDCLRHQHEADSDANSATACSEFAGDKTKFNHSESKAIKGGELFASTSNSAIQLSNHYIKTSRMQCKSSRRSHLRYLTPDIFE
jgi:hypothetical protein